jgi:hypothetical protein
MQVSLETLHGIKKKAKIIIFFYSGDVYKNLRRTLANVYKYRTFAARITNVNDYG